MEAQAVEMINESAVALKGLLTVFLMTGARMLAAAVNRLPGWKKMLMTWGISFVLSWLGKLAGAEIPDLNSLVVQANAEAVVGTLLSMGIWHGGKEFLRLLGRYNATPDDRLTFKKAG